MILETPPIASKTPLAVPRSNAAGGGTADRVTFGDGLPDLQLIPRPSGAPLNRLQQLAAEGTSIWLDYLSRDLLDTHDLQYLIERDGLRGETSNPTIFQKAISSGTRYTNQIRELAAQGKSPEQICWHLMCEDVQRACDVFKPLYDKTGGKDGFVSLELDPTLARNTDGAIQQARELWQRVDRANLMIKVPATVEGLPVIEQLVAEGKNVNVTLLFDADRHDAVMEAYIRGLERRSAAGQPVDGIASVASFFISRVDAEVDKRLDALGKGVELHGNVAVANARVAYDGFKQRFTSDRWKTLEAKGAQVQRPLWASTGMKNPNYSDTLYIDALIGPHCVNTAPQETIDKFRDRGTVKQTLTDSNLRAAHGVMEQVAAAGVDIHDVSRVLEDDGVKKFEDSYRDLLAAIKRQMEPSVAV